MAVGLAQVALQVKDLDDAIADRAADRIYSEMASYVDVPRAELLTSVRTNAARAVEVLTAGTVVEAEEVPESRATTRARIDQNVPIEDIIRAYRISLNVVHDAFIAEAERQGLEPQQTLTGSTLLWQLGDWFTTGAAAEYRYRAGAAALRESFATAALIRSLIDSEEPGPDVLLKARRYGLTDDCDYAIIICAAPEEPGGEHGFKHAGPSVESLQFSGSDGRRQAVVAQMDDRIVGIVARTPSASAAPVAVGPFVPLPRIAESARICERVWTVAQHSQPGVHSLADITWQIAVPAQTDLNRHLVDRYIYPLHPHTAAGSDVLETVRTWIATVMNVKKTAEVLHVHENTVRYRMQRFHDAVGLTELGAKELLDITWALAAFDLDEN
ncbi:MULTISPECIES: PucR family transcriptional regulator [unclassified Brevibacterium]|uniref:PucR family transcriptional regulator n=1 Tax=unclassified Brevibacterium TaxID=2614124 RepID=UPI001091E7CC|nr:helix-turn-helix domain-containing protein [Brevibacterium sp. S22]TGD30092.1 PucR family transcriptional regulator [Brevibacterium sp. S22]